MGQDEVLNRKRLMVLNRAAPEGSSQYLLEDPGLRSEPSGEDAPALEQLVIAALRTVHDPEIPLNIYDLGLVYRALVTPERCVEIDMTLTSPGCPVAGVLLKQAHDAVRKVPGVKAVKTALVWDPPWTRERMGDAAKLALGLL
jgi:FeS assembly SUF system protein